jgi:hypothetical protein
MTSMLTREFTQAGRTTRVTVERDQVGWQLREERDNTVVRHMHYSDWHRVERAIRSFELEHDFGADVSLR